MTTRPAPRALNKSRAEVAANAAAEKARKAASRAALKAARAKSEAEKTDAEILADIDAITLARTNEGAREVDLQRAAEDRQNALAAQAIDFAALNNGACAYDAEGAPTREFHAFLLANGYNPDGSPIPEKTRYNGPMLALVAARRTYVTATNGILCNGDELALLCGQHTREVVVKALIDALKLAGNPYLHLNPGQQSMNLRNKARRAYKDGMLTMAEVAAALNRASASDDQTVKAATKAAV